MSRYINVEDLHNVVMKRKAEYGRLADLIDNIVEEMVRGTPTADVVEREKIDKAIEAITKLRDSTSRMITDDVDFANECYKQYVNCFDECLRIIKRI